MREKFALIGIGSGAPAHPREFTPEMKAALSDAVKAAFTKIHGRASSVRTIRRRWHVARTPAAATSITETGPRAAPAKLGIYRNDSDEAVYPFARNDVNGLPLDGRPHIYALTFAPGELPPVNAFWSITMYDGRTQLLVDNSINRYLINSPMLPGLKTNPDGSLTIFIQKDLPGRDKEFSLAAGAGRADLPRHAALLAERPSRRRSCRSATGAGSRRRSSMSRTCARSMRRASATSRSRTSFAPTIAMAATASSTDRAGAGLLQGSPNIRGRSKTRTCGQTRSRPICSASSSCRPARR